MNLKIGVIKGDGIGPEIVTEAMKVIDKAAQIYGHTCEYMQLLMGGASIDVHGVPLTDETVAAAKSCDAVLMGSIGGDAKTSPWYRLEPSKRPEAGLLRIRKEPYRQMRCHLAEICSGTRRSRFISGFRRRS